MKTIRSYSKLVNEILNLNLAYRIEIIGYLEYDKIYPMLALKSISKMGSKTVIMTAGQHGDEHFAITTLLHWLKQPILFSDFNYYIFPICNPFGYEHNSRDNGAQQDTNNDSNFIKDSKVAELAILYEQFPQTADMIMDIHGDTGKDKVYCYEHKAENLPSIAEPALTANNEILPFIKTKTIYKIPVNNGVIIPPDYDIGIEGYMEKLGIKYSITLELPGKINGQQRTEGGIAIINSILKNFKETK